MSKESSISAQGRHHQRPCRAAFAHGPHVAPASSGRAVPPSHMGLICGVLTTVATSLAAMPLPRRSTRCCATWRASRRRRRSRRCRRGATPLATRLPSPSTRPKRGACRRRCPVASRRSPRLCPSSCASAARRRGRPRWSCPSPPPSLSPLPLVLSSPLSSPPSSHAPSHLLPPKERAAWPRTCPPPAAPLRGWPSLSLPIPMTMQLQKARLRLECLGVTARGESWVLQVLPPPPHAPSHAPSRRVLLPLP